MGEPRELHRFLCILVLITSALLPAFVAAAQSEAPPVFPLAEIERGQRGFGLSVFEGREPERFEVEVVGVWANVQPGTSYILARLSGRGLDETGVIAGMSGSPVFIENRLAGAVAFAWPFAHEAIAGITPIESMRRLARLETGAESGLGQGVSRLGELQTFDLVSIVRQELSGELLESSLEALRPHRVGEGTAALEWTASGFGGATWNLLKRSLGGLASAGQAPGYSGALVPGAAVSAVLIDGDLRLASTGTITDRAGDTVLAFGHPFFGIGKLAVPMAAAEVVTVISSLASSFKVANLGEIVGAFDFDHAVGVRGRIGLAAPMIPMRIRFRGSEERVVDLRLAKLEPITPVLVAISTLGALDSATTAVGSRGLDLLADLDLGTAGRVQIDQSFEGASANLDAALYLFAIVGYLLQNNLEAIAIESIDVEFERHFEPRTLRLVGAHAARSVVRPGDSVTVNLDLVQYRGGRIRKSVQIVMPKSLPAGRYSLLVGDGVSVDAARLAIERVEPVSFQQALELLDSLRSRRELAVIGVFGEAGLSVAGEVLPRLPASLRSLWGAAPSGSARPLRLAIAQQEQLRLPVPVDGILRIDLEVERRRPWQPEDADSQEPSEEPQPKSRGR